MEARLNRHIGDYIRAAKLVPNSTFLSAMTRRHQFRLEIDPATQAELSQLVVAIDRATGVVEQLLTLARVQGDRPAFGAVDLSGLTEDVARNLAPFAGKVHVLGVTGTGGARNPPCIAFSDLAIWLMFLPIGSSSWFERMSAATPSLSGVASTKESAASRR